MKPGCPPIIAIATQVVPAAIPAAHAEDALATPPPHCRPTLGSSQRRSENSGISFLKFNKDKDKEDVRIRHIPRRVLEIFTGAQLEEIPVFSQRWFVETVYRKQRRVAKAFNKAGKLICVFPYGQAKVMGLFPRLTSLDRWRRLSSFVFLDKNMSDEEKRGAVADIVKQLPRSMAHCEFIVDDESGIIRDGFIRAGFECIKMPKYIRRPSKQYCDRADAYAEAKDNVMKSISKDARARYRMTGDQVRTEVISASRFCRFYENNLIGMGEQSYSPMGIAEALIEDGVRRQKALTLAAKDKDGMEAAAVFLFDSKTMYAWLVSRKYHPHGMKFGHDDKHKRFCIDILVIEAMIFAELHGLVYDAEIVPVEKTGVPRSPHKIFVNEKILHLTKEESRFVLERRGWLYERASLVFYKVRDVAKRAVEVIERRSSPAMRRLRFDREWSRLPEFGPLPARGRDCVRAPSADTRCN